MTICPNCQTEIHPSDVERHGYGGPSHDPARCIELLRMRIAALEAENAALREELRERPAIQRFMEGK